MGLSSPHCPLDGRVATGPHARLIDYFATYHRAALLKLIIFSKGGASWLGALGARCDTKAAGGGAGRQWNTRSARMPYGEAAARSAARARRAPTTGAVRLTRAQGEEAARRDPPLSTRPGGRAGRRMPPKMGEAIVVSPHTSGPGRQRRRAAKGGRGGEVVDSSKTAERDRRPESFFRCV